MARKRQKNLEFDSAILDEFEKITKRKKITQSQVIEDFMKQYIAQDGQMIFDEIYAPRIGHTVKVAVDEQMNRLAGLINNTRIEATASLYSTPIFHNQMIKAFEQILETFINAQLLNPTRTSIAEKNSLNVNGKQSVRNLRNIALSDHKEQRKERAKEEMK